MQLTDLETPALVLDRNKLDRNLARMREHLTDLKVSLRPHVKTAKSIDVVRRALVAQPGQPEAKCPITVSTLKEAEYFFSNGITDILYAVGIAPNKLEHVAKLMKQGANMKILLDNAEAADMAAEKGEALGVRFPALIEIDSDGHRSGIQPGDPRLVDIGTRLHGRKGSRLAGVMTHAGDSYNCTTIDAIRAMAERERTAVVDCAQALKAAGLPCDIVSVGSTPTATYSENMEGVTEVRAGVYMFFDLFQAGIGVCGIDDIALSVLTSVIGHQPDKSWIITDGGWMAMSRDRGTANQKVDQGYGVVCDLAGRPIDDLIVTGTNQEHGIIADRDGGPVDLSRFPVGTLLRVLPNHACATAAQHPHYNVIAGEPVVEAVWPRFSGW
ncbi:MAG TPA: DSD1 family PLP-dependent enzyme [Burkholderiales bacterium]|nr:DSD1 family PLP-dependent enzyme [Burkholderiales bacterium]